MDDFPTGGKARWCYVPGLDVPVAVCDVVVAFVFLILLLCIVGDEALETPEDDR